jgi:hypothetical protein
MIRLPGFVTDMFVCVHTYLFGYIFLFVVLFIRRELPRDLTEGEVAPFPGGELVHVCYLEFFKEVLSLIPNLLTFVQSCILSVLKHTIPSLGPVWDLGC